ncbi:MAG: S41 family peptidase [Bacteroidetes bacterium]|jgi:carboxyl-terminal processing protease|nr:S41 family peptidase [Bacteroidota bacterium]
MKHLNFYTFIIGLLLLLSARLPAQNNNNFEISKSLDIYTSMMRELNLSYVDEINPAKLNEIAIKSMLDNLDPYTVFVPEAEIENFQLMTTGEYGGIGSLIQQIDGLVTITEPYEGFPAQQAGLIPGDAILQINKVEVTDKSTSEISELLKGQPGSTVVLKIKREGHDKPLEKTLIRQKIKIDNIPYHTVFDNQIGYVRLTGFTQKAASEMKEVLIKMLEEHELKGFIIDLRSNGGGLLNEAVDICNMFVDKGEIIVSTRGKVAERTTVHRTRLAPLDKTLPLVVMVNEGSASASEIVAGALQDLDRAVIIGQRTFGKGLVQNVVPLSYNTQMKLTVAKYYIPSGRCIQEIDYAHKNENGGKTPDSLIASFKTRKGRLVFEGKGIAPDVPLESQTYSAITANLYTGNYFFKFANKFARENSSISEIEKFEISDTIYDEFCAFLDQENFSYTTESELMIEKMREIAEEEAYKDAIETQLHALEEKLKSYKKNDLQKHRNEVEELLKMEIAQRYYYQKGKIIAALQNDPELKTAFDILEDEARYHKILSPNQ